MEKANLHILILAAGMGTRMKSERTKVLHPVLFRPILQHVIDIAKAVTDVPIGIVVGANRKAIEESCGNGKEIYYIDQPEALGTGHAVQCAASKLQKTEGDVLVLNGDVMLLTAPTIQELVKQHKEHGSAATLLSAKLENPFGYGRILRESSGGVKGIREQADCNEDEAKINEVNAGVYLFKIKPLFEALSKVETGNAQKEYYLTDVIEIFCREDKPVGAHVVGDSSEALGINDRVDLYNVENHLRRRTNHAYMKSGVTILDPESAVIDPRCVIEPDVTIEGNCRILNSTLRRGATIESGCRIEDSEVKEDVRLKEGCYVESSKIGEKSVVGPYAHLRPGSDLGREVKLGNFVEVKKSQMGDGSKASHLSYVGDARIGKNVNLGCGFITCNYDGFRKHQTVIEDDVFVGSDSQTVAPVTLGKGAYVASGTTITKNVPSKALAIARVTQKNLKDMATKLQKKLKGK